MRWIVRGADKVTGEARTMPVEAELKSQAEMIANRQGLLIDSIVPADALTLTEEKKTPMPPGVNNIPDYGGLKLVAMAARIATCVYLALAAISLALAIAAADQGFAQASVPLAMAIGWASAAILAFGFAAGCEALRDIARNSWRTR